MGLFIIDLDGTLLKGKEIIAGANELEEEMTLTSTVALKINFTLLKTRLTVYNDTYKRFESA